MILMESSESLAWWRLWRMKYELKTVHCSSFVHIAEDAFFRLPNTKWSEKFIDDDVPGQCTAHYYNETCLVDPDTKAYFDPKVDEFLEIMPLSAEDVQLSLVGKFFEARRADYLCEKLTAAAGDPRNRSNTDENGILPQRTTSDGSLQNVLPLSCAKQPLITPTTRCRLDILEGDGCMTPCRKHITSRIWPTTCTHAWRHPWAVHEIVRPIDTNVTSNSFPLVTTWNLPRRTSWVLCQKRRQKIYSSLWKRFANLNWQERAERKRQWHNKFPLPSQISE